MEAKNRAREFFAKHGTYDGAEKSIEEFVRQLALKQLLDVYNYPKEWLGERLIIEEPVKMGSGEKEADISLKNENRRTFLYLEAKVFEISDSYFREAERQLESYLASTHTATIGMLTDGKRVKCIRKKIDPNDFEYIPDIPGYGAEGMTARVKLVREIPKANSAAKTGLQPLSDKYERVLFECHSTIRDVDGLHDDEALDELSKVLYTKTRHRDLQTAALVEFDGGFRPRREHRGLFSQSFCRCAEKIPALPNLDFKIRRANSLIDMVRGHPVNMKHGGADEKGMLPPILNRLITAKRQFYDAHKMTDKRRLRFDILDATAELAMYEFSATKTDIGLIPDEKDSARVAELASAEREMGWLRQQIRAARKKPAAQQDDELERLGKQFDDEQKPTFVWQLDFAEVFHRTPAAAARFDLVIGNPPYGIVFNLREKDILEEK